MLKRRPQCRRIVANAQPGPFEGRRAGRRVAAAPPPRLVRRQRLRGADLRGRLAPAAPAGRSAPRRSRWACCWARSWAACASAASSCRATCRRGPPAAGLRDARDWALAVVGDRGALWGAAGRQPLCRQRAAWVRRDAAARPPVRRLPAAADDADGRHAAGDRPLGRDDAAKACPGLVSSTAATSPARSSAACWPASTCCASTTWRRRRSSRSRSTWRSACSGCALAASTGEADPADARIRPVRLDEPGEGGPAIYVAIGLSGLCALAAEVIWTRILSLMLGATDLHLLDHPRGVPVRLGIGSSVGSMLAAPHVARVPPWRVVRRSRLAIAWAAVMLGDSLPVLADQPVAVDESVVSLQLDLVRCCLGAAARDDPVGRKLPARARRGRRTGSGSRPPGRWRLRRQHHRRDRRRGRSSAW